MAQSREKHLRMSEFFSAFKRGLKVLFTFNFPVCQLISALFFCIENISPRASAFPRKLLRRARNGGTLHTGVTTPSPPSRPGAGMGQRWGVHPHLLQGAGPGKGAGELPAKKPLPCMIQHVKQSDNSPFQPEGFWTTSSPSRAFSLFVLPHTSAPPGPAAVELAACGELCSHASPASHRDCTEPHWGKPPGAGEPQGRAESAEERMLLLGTGLSFLTLWKMRWAQAQINNPCTALGSQQQGNKWRQLEILYKQGWMQEGIPSLAPCRVVNSVTLGTAGVSLGGLQGCERADMQLPVMGSYVELIASGNIAPQIHVAMCCPSRHAAGMLCWEFLKSIPGSARRRCKVEAGWDLFHRKKSTCVHVIKKCIRETDTAGLQSMPFSIYDFMVPFGWMHHSMALTHEMVVEQLFVFTASWSERRGGGADNAGKVEINHLAPFHSLCQHTMRGGAAWCWLMGSVGPVPWWPASPGTQHGSRSQHRPVLLFNSFWWLLSYDKSCPAPEARTLPGFLPGSSLSKTSLTGAVRKKSRAGITVFVLMWLLLLGEALGLVVPSPMTLEERGQQITEPAATAIGYVPAPQHIKGCLNGGKRASFCSFFFRSNLERQREEDPVSQEGGNYRSHSCDLARLGVRALLSKPDVSMQATGRQGLPQLLSTSLCSPPKLWVSGQWGAAQLSLPLLPAAPQHWGQAVSRRCRKSNLCSTQDNCEVRTGSSRPCTSSLQKFIALSVQIPVCEHKVTGFIN